MKKYWIRFVYYIFRYEPHIIAAREKIQQYEEITGICNSKLPKYGNSLKSFMLK